MRPTDIKKELKETYDTIAPEFDATRKMPWKEVESFLKTLPKKSLVFDLGGGTGRHSLLAQSLGLKAICYDQSEGQLVQAKKNGVKNCMLGDVVSLPFDNNSVDAIIYIATLHHLPTEKERVQSLKECKRVLKKNGKLLVSVWRKGQVRFKGKEDAKGDVHHTWRGKFPRFYHLFSEDELGKIATSADFVPVTVWKSGDNLWLQAEKTP